MAEMRSNNTDPDGFHAGERVRARSAATADTGRGQSGAMLAGGNSGSGVRGIGGRASGHVPVYPIRSGLAGIDDNRTAGVQGDIRADAVSRYVFSRHGSVVILIGAVVVWLLVITWSAVHSGVLPVE